MPYESSKSTGHAPALALLKMIIIQIKSSLGRICLKSAGRNFKRNLKSDLLNDSRQFNGIAKYKSDLFGNGYGENPPNISQLLFWAKDHCDNYTKIDQLEKKVLTGKHCLQTGKVDRAIS